MSDVVKEDRRAVLYRYFDKNDRLLYVGISLNVVARMIAHRDSSPWWDDAVRVTFEHYTDWDALVSAEQQAIKDEQPEHNIAGKTKAYIPPSKNQQIQTPEQRARWARRVFLLQRTMSYITAEESEHFRRGVFAMDVAPPKYVSKLFARRSAILQVRDDEFDRLYEIAAGRQRQAHPDEEQVDVQYYQWPTWQSNYAQYEAEYEAERQRETAQMQETTFYHHEWYPEHPWLDRMLQIEKRVRNQK